uniref:Uncharacterized protein n=1 Tax=Avena sativa TaxID=4498 RepID=A0ACD5Z5K1_AVESA
MRDYNLLVVLLIMIVRRSNGTILLSSCRSLRHCTSALESELCAIMEGVALALEWSQDQILIETDSTEIVRLLSGKEQDLSTLGHLVMEARSLISDRIAGICKIPRSQNVASHLLAQFGRLNNHTAVWLGSGPESILDSLIRDCNNIVI